MAGAGEVRDEVHQDYEVPEEDEQLQLLPGNSLRPRLRPHPPARYRSSAVEPDSCWNRSLLPFPFFLS